MGLVSPPEQKEYQKTYKNKKMNLFIKINGIVLALIFVISSIIIIISIYDADQGEKTLSKRLKFLGIWSMFLGLFSALYKCSEGESPELCCSIDILLILGYFCILNKKIYEKIKKFIKPEN